MELAEREGQAGRLRREPGNDEGSGETRNEPPLRGDRNGLLLLPPSAAVWTQKGRIYITYRRTDRTTKDSLAQQVWVYVREEKVLQSRYSEPSAPHTSLIFPSYSASLSGASVK